MDPAAPTPAPGHSPPGASVETPGAASNPDAADGVAEPIFDAPPYAASLATGTPSDGGDFASPVFGDGPPPLPAGPPRPPGPGLPEAVGWTFGVFMVQAFAGVAMVIVAMAVLFARGGMDGSDEARTESLKALMSMDGPEGSIIIVGSQVIFALAALAAAWLRLRPGWTQRLSLNGPPLRHAAMLFLAILPVSLVCGQIYQSVKTGWDALTEALPGLRLFDGMNVMTQMEKIVEGIPVPLLFLAIAVVPALAEELIFRGVVGRGLVARWGVPVGILVTSILFASAHMHPVHVIAVVPLGIFMHIAYLATRSFWAPMALHFINNSMATVGLLLQRHAGELAEDSPAAKVLTDSTPPSLPLLLSAGMASLAAIIFLWRTRVQYVSPDGEVWNPGYTTVEAPPDGRNFARRCRPASPLVYAAAALCTLAFAAVFTQSLVQEAEKAKSAEPSAATPADAGD